MTEILTESFCERCGTRYTFESARPRVRLKGVKTMSRGLKNFVLSDDTSMDEAMAAARAETERESTSYQLDAFHKTFNFCMSCRQYTCPNCWNEAEARCLSCAPHLGREVLPAPFPDLATTEVTYQDLTAGGAIRVEGNGVHAPEVESEPASDDMFDVAARLAALTMAPEPRIAADPVVLADAEASVDAGTVVGAEAPAVQGEAPAVQAEAPAVQGEAPSVQADTAIGADGPATAVAEPESPSVVVEPEPSVDIAAAVILADHDPREDAPAALVAPAKPAGKSKGLFRRFRPGQDIDAELDAYEREHAAAAAAATAAVIAAGDESVEAVAEPEEIAEPEAVAATEPEPVEAVLQAQEVAAPEALAAAEPEPVEAVLQAEEIAEPQTVVAVEREPETVAAVEPVAVVEPESEPFTAVEPAPEPIAVAVAAEPELEPVAAVELVDAVEPDPEPVAAVEPEPELIATAELVAAVGAIAAAEPEPEPVAAAEPEPEPVAEPEPEPVAAAEPAPPADDIVPQPTWRMVAPDSTVDETQPASPALPAAATADDPTSEPQWPTRPSWLNNAPSVGLPFLNRPAAPQGGVDALWAESNREVAAQRSAAKPASAVQPCVSCGLSLSATARFCRRCGSAQG